MNSYSIHLDDRRINGVDYLESVLSGDPLEFHKNACVAAERLRRKYGIKDVSVNPWFYFTPPSPRRVHIGEINGIQDLWKLYAPSGEDTDSDEDKSGKVVGTSSESKTSPLSANSGDPKEISKNEVDPPKVSKKKKRKKKSKKQKSPSTPIAEPLEFVNYAKEREENLLSLYGTEAFHIKALEDWSEILKINYIDKFHPIYWPCEPINHRYAFQKLNNKN